MTLTTTEQAAENSPASDRPPRRRERRFRYGLLLLPVLVFNVAVFLLPMLAFGLSSLHPYEGPALVGDAWTLDNWAAVVTDPLLRQTLLQSTGLVLIITVGTVIVGFPLSYIIARSRKWGGLLLLVVISSSFVSAVVLTLGWLMLLSGSGPVISAIAALGIPADDIRILQTPAAIVIAMVHVELHYMVLICTPTIMTIPRQLEEAAQGLGSTWMTSMIRVVLPLSWPGILGGALIVMATAAGSFTTPAVLGGQLVPWLPTYIYGQMRSSLNYPMAATASVTLVILVILLSTLATLSSRILKGRRNQS